MSYSQKFIDAVAIVLKDEGGYVWDKNDSGGETNFGISKRSYPNVDIKKLTRDGAIAIYYSDFWCKGPYEGLADSALASKVFNTSVNAGQSRAIKLLQQAANAQGANLVVDGLAGPKTIAAINAMYGPAVLASYREAQEAFYMAIIARDPSQAKFKNGWIKRARS